MSARYQGVTPDELDRLAAGQAHLRDLRALSRVQSQQHSLAPSNFVPMLVDDRFVRQPLMNTSRKSAMPVEAPDRFVSEIYPIPVPPRQDFLWGQNTRLLGKNEILVVR